MTSRIRHYITHESALPCGRNRFRFKTALFGALVRKPAARHAFVWLVIAVGLGLSPRSGSAQEDARDDSPLPRLSIRLEGVSDEPAGPGANSTIGATEVDARLELADRVVVARVNLGSASPVPSKQKEPEQSATSWRTRLPMRFKLEGKQRLFGTRRFVLRDPAVEGAAELASAYASLRERNVLAPRLHQVRVDVAGEDLGVLSVEEDFSKELNESQGRRTGVLFRLDTRALPRARVVAFGGKKLASSPDLASQLETARGLLQGYLNGELSANEVFDLERMRDFYEVLDGGPYPWMATPEELRFYFNPVTQLIEPVGFSECPCSAVSPNASAAIEAGLAGRPLAGLTPARKQPALHAHPIPKASLEQALARHGFLAFDEERRRLRIDAGVHEVSSSLVLPTGLLLEIEPGTTLRFAKDAMLLASGALEFKGAPDAPIVLEGRDGGSWPGVVVMEAAKPVHWQHVVVRGTRGIDHGSWILTGGVTIRRAEVVLRNSILEGSSAEDALNLIHADIDLEGVEIDGARSDALDCDFCTGRIVGGLIHDVGGDGIDVSGSRVTVEGTRLERVHDKAISVGEGSHLDARRVSIAHVGTAVAGKDGSEVTIEESTISDVEHVAMMAYCKKQEFGPGRITARGVLFERAERPAVAQKGSRISLDGVDVPTEDLDVEQLYKHGYMKK